MMTGFEIRNITIRGFRNKGLFTENVDGFKIIDVESVDHRNYGIFPALSKDGIVTHSRAVGSDIDSGIWVETSENVVVTHNLVEGNVNGIEVSNSDDILVAHNEARENKVGAAVSAFRADRLQVPPPARKHTFPMAPGERLHGPASSGVKAPRGLH
jgi:parallel beta-helix repeat protein